jgi:uncharacterized RDD family membrane protein YckC
MAKEVHYAGFWVRLIADLIDSTVLDLAACLLMLTGLGTLYWVRKVGWSTEPRLGLDSFNSFHVQIGLVILRSTLGLVYYVQSTYYYGTTLGKKPLGIYVVSADQLKPVTWNQSLFRCLGYLASYIPVGCGFFMVLFQPQKRALHDVLAGTLSVIRKKQPKGIELKP